MIRSGGMIPADFAESIHRAAEEPLDFRGRFEVIAGIVNGVSKT